MYFQFCSCFLIVLYTPWVKKLILTENFCQRLNFFAHIQVFAMNHRCIRSLHQMEKYRVAGVSQIIYFIQVTYKYIDTFETLPIGSSSKLLLQLLREHTLQKVVYRVHVNYFHNLYCQS